MIWRRRGVVKVVSVQQERNPYREMVAGYFAALCFSLACWIAIIAGIMFWMGTFG